MLFDWSHWQHLWSDWFNIHVVHVVVQRPYSPRGELETKKNVVQSENTVIEMKLTEKAYLVVR